MIKQIELIDKSNISRNEPCYVPGLTNQDMDGDVIAEILRKSERIVGSRKEVYKSPKGLTPKDVAGDIVFSFDYARNPGDAPITYIGIGNPVTPSNYVDEVLIKAYGLDECVNIKITDQGTITEKTIDLIMKNLAKRANS